MIRQQQEANKALKRSARKDRRNWANRQAQAVAESNNMRKLYQLTKKLGSKSYNNSSPISSTDGTLITSRDGQLAR